MRIVSEVWQRQATRMKHRTTTKLQPPAERRLGVDIGRVIIHGDGPDTSFIGGSDADALRAPPMAGALEALARLARALEGRVWLVSKCGPRIEARSRAWLARQRFFETTSIAPEHLHFCRDRRDKAPICKRIGIQCFVDDRGDVLEAMRGIVAHRLLFGAHAAPRADVTPVPTWYEAEAAILAAFGLSAASARSAEAPGIPAAPAR
jgi:hypothetical protein